MTDRTELSTDNNGNQATGNHTVYMPSQPASYSIGQFGPAFTDIVMPDTPLNIKGKFSYFGIKWDGHDIANAHQNETVRINTVEGYHRLEIRQVNDTFFSMNIQRFEFHIYVRNRSVHRVENDGSALRISTASN